MQCLEGARTPEMRKGRGTLTARVPQFEALLKGLNLDGDNLAAARRVCNNLWAWRNEFDLRRRGGGMFTPGRLDKAGAERTLARLLREVC